MITFLFALIAPALYLAFRIGRWLGHLDRDEAKYIIVIAERGTGKVLFEGTYNLEGLHETAKKMAGQFVVCKQYLEEERLGDMEALEKALEVMRR